MSNAIHINDRVAFDTEPRLREGTVLDIAYVVQWDDEKMGIPNITIENSYAVSPIDNGRAKASDRVVKAAAHLYHVIILKDREDEDGDALIELEDALKEYDNEHM